jgi:hypothetical protein
MNRIFKWVCVFVLSGLALQTQAQTDDDDLQDIHNAQSNKIVLRPTDWFTPKDPIFPKTTFKARYKVAAFVPFFLDSVFRGGNLPRVQLPKYVYPGLEFYQGMMLAIDSLNKTRMPIDLYVYDSKDRYKSIPSLIRNNTLQQMDLIIGAVNAEEVNDLAAYAQKQRINFVSAVSPQDAGMFFNPYFTILYPRLTEHCEALREYINEKFRNEKIWIIKRKGAQMDETAIKYFKEASKKNPVIAEIEYSSEMTAEFLASKLDPEDDNVIFVPVLDLKTSKEIVRRIYGMGDSIKVHVFGMPTWDGMELEFQNKTNMQNDIFVYYSTSLYENYNPENNSDFRSKYKKQYGSWPGTQAYTGFETMMYYARLLRENGVYFNKDYRDYKKGILTEYRIRPVIEDGEFRYFMNTRLFLKQYNNGVLNIVN